MSGKDKTGKLSDPDSRIRQAKGEKMAKEQKDQKQLMRENEALRRRIAALELEAQRFKATLYSIGDAVIATDAGGKIVQMNHVAEKLTGWPEAEALGQPAGAVFRIINEETGAEVESPVTRVLREGAVVGLANHTMLIARDGTRRPIADSGAPICDAHDKVTGVVMVFRDQTEERTAQKALRNSEENYRNLVENASIGIFRTRIDGSRVLDANPKLCEILGLTREEFVGQPSAIAWAHPEQREDLVRLLREKGTVNNYEIDLRTKSGEIRTVIMSMITYPELGYLEGGMQDITERKLAESKLAAAQQLYRELFENVNIGILRTTPGPEGAFVDLNPAMVKLFEADNREQLMALHPSKIYWDESQRKFISDAIVAKGTAKEEIKFKTLKGKPIWCRITAVKKIDASGQVYFDDTIEDITERKQFEAALREANENLGNSNKELEQFAYVASHDLQEPLRMVSSYTQLLEQRYKDKLDQDAKDFIGYAVDGANRMQRLIQDLLEYSRVTTRGQPPALFDAHDALGEAIKNLQVAIQESGALVTSNDLPMVLGDRTQIVQVFQNLIGNGIKFQRPDVAPLIHISAEDDLHDNRLRLFKVSDNGIGIEPRHFERLFQIFQRLNSKKEYPGTGIGLALCKRIVERHGGRIWVESEPGKGSVFFFTLPAEDHNNKGEPK
ncbi:MAG: PAS domain S-box protein [Candidatus Aminicenantes bacterium]|nr:PAS domain S-box protein [Candidatus Aminicenantes bacterium]